MTDRGEDGALWGVLGVRPGQEVIFRDRGVAQQVGMGIYLPMRRVKSRPAGHRRAKTVLRPAIAGYAFFWPLEGIKNFRGYLDLTGVTWWMLRFGGEPAEIASQEIARLRDMEKSGSLDTAPRDLTLALTKGRRVVVLSGPMVGVEGIVVTQPKSGTEVVKLDLANSTVKVKVDNVSLV
jgi:hypothetical protein